MNNALYLYNFDIVESVVGRAAGQWTVDGDRSSACWLTATFWLTAISAGRGAFFYVPPSFSLLASATIHAY